MKIIMQNNELVLLKVLAEEMKSLSGASILHKSDSQQVIVTFTFLLPGWLFSCGVPSSLQNEVLMQPLSVQNSSSPQFTSGSS